MFEKYKYYWKFKFLLISASVLSASMLTSCNTLSRGDWAKSDKTTPASADSTELNTGNSKEFDDFLMKIFKDQVTSNSIDFHYTLEHPENYGLSMDKVTFGTVSLEDMDESLKETREALETLKTFDYEKLSADQQFIYDMLLDSFEDSIKSFDYTLYETIFSPTIGVQAQLPIIFSEYTFRSKQDVDDYILLLEDVDRYFSQLLDIEKAKSEAGLFMADFTVDAIVAQCEEFISNPEENLLIDIFPEKLDLEIPDLTVEEKDTYIQKNNDAVINNVIPAYEMIIDELTALKGTGTNEGGLCNFDDGKDYYSILAKTATGSSKTVEEMIEMTESALNNDLMSIAMIYTQNPDIFEESAKAKPPSSDPETILTQLQTSILDEFPEPVSTQFNIKYVHESLEQNLSPAFYMIPAIDAADSNTIYINNYYTNSDNTMSLYTTLAHEGYPGHLYETTWFNSTDPHPIRKILSYSGYSEGWATYVEMQSFYWACDNEDIADVLRANQDFSLGICARADMGINYEGWSREDTKTYLDQYGMGSDETVDWIFEAVIAEPANYLSYYIGYLEFKQLRQYAQTALDDQFDPVSFHKLILTTGPAPFEQIQERVDTWIDESITDKKDAA